MYPPPSVSARHARNMTPARKLLPLISVGAHKNVLPHLKNLPLTLADTDQVRSKTSKALDHLRHTIREYAVYASKTKGSGRGDVEAEEMEWLDIAGERTVFLPIECAREGEACTATEVGSV